jgi:hypothetical protein
MEHGRGFPRFHHNKRTILDSADHHSFESAPFMLRLSPPSMTTVSAQLDAGLFLQVADDAEQVAGLRIAARAEHADEALRLGAGRLAQLLETDRRLDVVAQDRLADVAIAGKHAVDAFAQQRFAEGGVACDPFLHQLLETPRQCHLLPPFTSLRRGNSVAQAPALHKRLRQIAVGVCARQPRELSLIYGKPSVSHSRLRAKRVP